MPPYIKSLDKLRGIAVLLVLFTHTPSVLKGPAGLWFQAYLEPGYMGVDLFFALSGFLITRILLADKERGAGMRGFWIRRAVRIFPAAYLTLAVVACLWPGPELPWVATYTSNFYFLGEHSPSPLAHTWSLAVEEHFYLVWPLLLFGLSRSKSLLVILGGMLPLAAATAWFVIARHPAEQLVYLGHITPARILTLSLGSLLAFAEPRLRARPGAWTVVGLLGVVLGYTWVLAGFLVPALRPTVGFHHLFGFALFSTSVVLLFIEADRLKLPRPAALLGTPLAFIGRISYGLYLYHLPIFFAFDVRGSAASGRLTASRMVLAIGTSLVVAVLSYYSFERPLLRWGRRFRD